MLAGVTSAARAEETKKTLKIMFKSAWGSEDPTRTAFAFLLSGYWLHVVLE
jgi:hypothetical protein